MSEPTPVSLEVFYGVSSPWAYFGAHKLEAIAKRHGITIFLKPITVIVENGGIPLKARHPAYQAYHAIDLDRHARYLGIPLKGVPKKYYPQAPGGIQLSAQAIIRIQRKFGIGCQQALDFSFAVMRTIWDTEEDDHCKLEFLQTLGRRVGLSEEEVQELIVDHRSDKNDPAVVEWNENYRTAISRGIFGTPTYVVNGEIFWGQDRLFLVEDRIERLLKAGAKPKTYA